MAIHERGRLNENGPMLGEAARPVRSPSWLADTSDHYFYRYDLPGCPVIAERQLGITVRINDEP